MCSKLIREWFAFAVLLLALTGISAAATPVYRVRTDLKPLIRAVADSPVQFAVLVPHAVSTATGGRWSNTSGVAHWNYAVQVPTAVSLSFHAFDSLLPEGAILIVKGVKTTTSYRARDFHHNELWSRVYPGQAIQFELSVAAKDRSKVRLNIISLQAGYRAIGPGVEDHPYYRQLKALQALAISNTSCVTNFECKITSSDTPPGAATVGLVIGNLYQCTGALINNLAGDNFPYVLTARHCESGKLGGGNPGAASSVTVYWDATGPCGAALGSLYDPGISTQTGAQTVVEQQDAWLLLLDQGPVVSDAQFAGFDATGGSVQGGYTIHHATGADKQFAGWFGQAAYLQQSNVIGVTYLSDFWETVNAIGNIGPGASGGGLFDQNNRLVGSLTFGRQTTDPSGYESCPAANPVAPNGTNGVADFTALSAVWNSTADTTSSTGTATLKGALDPASTGTLVAPSAPVTNIQLGADMQLPTNGTLVQLFWSAPNATGCIASGGVAGDGWTGNLLASGSLSVTESNAGFVTYTLTCTYPGGGTAKTSRVVDWVGPNPFLQFSAPQVLWTTRPAVLTWSSNVAPCSISGGGLSLSSLAASGTTTTTQSAAGDITYTLTCGPSNDQGTRTASVSYVTPSLYLEATGTDRILGQTFVLQWIAYADACIPSGGAPNDGWGTSAFGPPSISASGGPTGAFAPNVTTLGTYTYTLTCSSGPVSEQQSVTVTFENNAPYVTATASTTSVTYSNSPADYVTLNYNSNMSSCTINTAPHLPYSYNDSLAGYAAYQAQGSIILNPPGPGTYTISVTCALPGNNPTVVTSQPVMLTVLPPPAPTATISIKPSTVVVGQIFTVSWTSTNALDCAQTGGIPGFDWGGTGVVYNEPPAGSITGNTIQAGQYTFGISCQSLDPNQGKASDQATLLVSQAGSSSGGSSSSGSSSSGSGSTSGGGASGGGHGGGGATDRWDLAALLALLIIRGALASRKNPVRTVRS